MARRNKYNAKKTVVDGIEFDSIREAERYRELKLLERGKEIRNLVLQPRFLLQDKFVDKHGKTHRKIEYVADFLYIDKDDNAIVEDVKGMLTAVYKLKKKMFLKIYDEQYEFREIRWKVGKITKLGYVSRKLEAIAERDLQKFVRV